MASHYKKVKSLKFPKPEPTVQYDKPIGPERPKGAGEIVKESVIGWAKRGMANFAENARRPVTSGPSQAIPGKKKSSRRRDIASEYEPHGMDFGGFEMDFSNHPDPMYRRTPKEESRGERRPRRKVTTRTVTYY